MWWDESFEQLNWDFNTYDSIEDQKMHSNYMRMLLLIRKIESCVLALMKMAINSELSRISIIYISENSLKSYINVVNQITRPEMSANKHDGRINNKVQ